MIVVTVSTLAGLRAAETSVCPECAACVNRGKDFMLCPDCRRAPMVPIATAVALGYVKCILPTHFCDLLYLKITIADALEELFR